ncbi:glycosyltransferase family 2 protein [Fictibacillus sp. UD]|uniref:glycosyltransferase family 2 protein n=1 Tax=Fictibacillus sp. UD TaxID=3038777 RepID=UPI0037462C45
MLASVITAVFNGEKYLQESIESILNQTIKEIEFIIVNDGSTDSTKDILDAITDKRVKIIHLEKNLGAANALNTGITYAKSDWIAIQDADDISMPTRIEEQLLHVSKNPHLVGVSSLVECIKGNIPVSPSIFYGEQTLYNIVLNKEDNFNSRFYNCYVCHGSVMFSKEAFQRVNGYNPHFKISYDYDLWLRLYDIYPIEKINRILYQYRVLPNSLGKRSKSDTISELMTSVIHFIGNSIISNKKKNNPSFVVLGSKKGCSFVMKKVKLKEEINIMKFLDGGKNRSKKIALEYYNQGLIDGIIILNNKNAQHLIDYFLDRGLIFNQDVFKIWNYKF